MGADAGDLELSGPPRLRRDIKNLVSLSRAHAVLHQTSRDRDDDGRIVSTLDDYEVVRALLSDAIAVATDKTVRQGTRKIVEAVEELRAQGKKTVSLRAASTKAGRSTSTTHTDVHDGLDRGYLVNRSQAENRYDLDVGDPLPDHGDLLPSTEDLAQAFADCSASVRPPTERPKPASEAGSRGSVRSVRSDIGGGGGTHLWRGLGSPRPQAPRAEIVTEQLSFDLDATAHENDPISQIRANVTEPGMTEAEIEALVQDALDQTGGKPNRNGAGPLQAKPCQCERPLQMPNAWVPVATCARCGRLPRGGS